MAINIQDIEKEAIVFFELKYPLMDLCSDGDKYEIDWYDMLEFAKYLLENNKHE
jgi:hypothetical protein